MKICILSDSYQSFFIAIDKTILNCNHSVIISVIYRPPNSSACICNKELDAILSAIQTELKYAYIIGDSTPTDIHSVINYQLMPRSLVILLLPYPYYQMIVKPTCITISTASLLDNNYINVDILLVLTELIFQIIIQYLLLLMILVMKIQINLSTEDTFAIKIL